MKSSKHGIRSMISLLLILQAALYSASFALRPIHVPKVPCRASTGSPSTSRVIYCKTAATRSRTPTQLHSSPNGDTDQGESTTNTKSSNGRRNAKQKKDLYGILGASPAMSKSEIKRLYISLAKQSHPDSPSYNPADSIDFTEIASAYKILSDDKLRRRYDREVAAEEFTGDIVAYASEVAKEYGPVAKKIYEDWALPFLKRTTASTVAGLSAIGEVTAESNSGRDEAERTRIMGSTGDRAANRSNTSGASLSEMVSEMTRLEKQSNGNRALEDFGKAFQRVIEAGRNATRQIDGAELQEKSMELRQRADEARAESLVTLEQLSALKAERLRLTFHTSNIDFSSEEALQFLEGFNTEDNADEIGIMGRMGFKHTIREDIETFSLAEEEFEKKMQEKENVDNQAAAMMRELERAEKNTRDAEMELEEARRRLERAQQQLANFQTRVTEIQRDMNNVNLMVRRADQELSKSDQHLKRKRDVVRRALKRKDEIYGQPTQPMNTFDTGTDGSVRLNSAFDRSSSMNDARLEDQNIAKIEQLRREEANIESEFLMLVEKASRLVSRSERLRLRSEALIGKQNVDAVEQSTQGNKYEVDPSSQGTVIGDNIGEIPL